MLATFAALFFAAGVLTAYAGVDAYSQAQTIMQQLAGLVWGCLSVLCFVGMSTSWGFAALLAQRLTATTPAPADAEVWS